MRRVPLLVALPKFLMAHPGGVQVDGARTDARAASEVCLPCFSICFNAGAGRATLSKFQRALFISSSRGGECMRLMISSKIQQSRSA